MYLLTQFDSHVLSPRVHDVTASMIFLGLYCLTQRSHVLQLLLSLSTLLTGLLREAESLAINYGQVGNNLPSSRRNPATLVAIIACGSSGTLNARYGTPPGPGATHSPLTHPDGSITPIPGFPRLGLAYSSSFYRPVAILTSDMLVSVNTRSTCSPFPEETVRRQDGKWCLLRASPMLLRRIALHFREAEEILVPARSPVRQGERGLCDRQGRDVALIYSLCLSMCLASPVSSPRMYTVQSAFLSESSRRHSYSRQTFKRRLMVDAGAFSRDVQRRVLASSLKRSCREPYRFSTGKTGCDPSYTCVSLVVAIRERATPEECGDLFQPEAYPVFLCLC
nr:hypothetical protein Iba_chr10bCG13370 [Ipomoea batatas]